MSKRDKKLPILSEHASLVDSHCHLDMAAYEGDLQDVLQRAADHRISHIISIGIDLDSSRKAIALAEQHQHISATIGIHPHDVDNISSSSYDELAEIADSHRQHIVGYGEIGLDYVKQYSDPGNQRSHFANQLSLARDLHLPVIIHDREAHEDTLSILKQAGPCEYGGVMHCFSGDMELAKKVLDFGFYISITGVVTFKKAHELHEVARSIPIESMLIETDGPFLTPDPFRGKRNEPVYTLFTAARIAELRGLDLDEVATQTTANACALFDLPNF